MKRYNGKNKAARLVSKEQLLEDNEQLRRDNGVLLAALNYLARGEFQIVGRRNHHHYTVRLAGATEAHGGIVLVTFAPPGQKPYSSAHYLDEWFAHWRDYPPSNDKEVQAVRALAQHARRIANEQQTGLTQPKGN